MANSGNHLPLLFNPAAAADAKALAMEFKSGGGKATGRLRNNPAPLPRQSATEYTSQTPRSSLHALMSSAQSDIGGTLSSKDAATTERAPPKPTTPPVDAVTLAKLRIKNMAGEAEASGTSAVTTLPIPVTSAAPVLAFGPALAPTPIKTPAFTTNQPSVRSPQGPQPDWVAHLEKVRASFLTAVTPVATPAPQSKDTPPIPSTPVKKPVAPAAKQQPPTGSPMLPHVKKALAESTTTPKIADKNTEGEEHALRVETAHAHMKHTQEHKNAAKQPATPAPALPSSAPAAQVEQSTGVTRSATPSTSNGTNIRATDAAADALKSENELLYEIISMTDKKKELEDKREELLDKIGAAIADLDKRIAAKKSVLRALKKSHQRTAQMANLSVS